MKHMLVLALMLLAGISLSGCSGDTPSQAQSQQAQIATLQTQLSAVQTQLSSAKADGSVYNAGITTAIASLRQTESALATLAGQPANANATPLTTAANQVLVLQSLAASLSSDTSALSAAYATAQASITNLTTQLNAANAQVTSLTAQLAASQSSNSVLSGQLADANLQVTTLTNQIATLQTQLANANDTIATRDATIVSLNSTISTLQAQISAMVATPVAMSASALTAAVSTAITVTATFPSTENGKTAIFTATGGNLLTTPANVTIAGNTASTTFNSASPGTFNIYVVEGLHAGGAIVTITAAPAPTYTVSGTISLNGTGLPNVIVALTGAATGAATTDASGNYSFAGLQNGSYTVTPLRSGYSFKPSSLAVTVSGANVTGQNFTDIVTKTYSCSGALSPLGRWCDNGDGTVRDMTTGLLWLKNANCATTLGGVTSGGGNTWFDALTWSSYLASGSCGLSDGSHAMDWRLPTIGDFSALVTGTEPVLAGTPRLFTNIQSNFYWSSYSIGDGNIWQADIGTGYGGNFPSTDLYYIWAVR
ncbi:DUF1566 domain-containing protein [Oryzomonas sagensis]|uniref:DUF1566 domain-containing protein n=1 Tax=Oryzomonas sagensis TaxID=2603857 RepID=A0ABQ6TLA0_9BACT|nr:DUF1566 domain-containing protein [Oryzomonas sagensis]KAB0669055.1 DUF1566 domain-containing protein [Oryzomonas sagensis]